MDGPGFQSGSKACGGEMAFGCSFIDHHSSGICGSLLEEGVAYAGDIIGEKVLNVLSSLACAQLCKNENECILWSYYMELKRCALKTSYKGRYVNQGYISGQKPCI